MMGLSDSERTSMIMFSRFDTMHACDRRTDRRIQTDGIAVACTALSIASRGKNSVGYFLEHPVRTRNDRDVITTTP